MYTLVVYMGGFFGVISVDDRFSCRLNVGELRNGSVTLISNDFRLLYKVFWLFRNATTSSIFESLSFSIGFGSSLIETVFST